jgi:hypothetical protein
MFGIALFRSKGKVLPYSKAILGTTTMNRTALTRLRALLEATAPELIVLHEPRAPQGCRPLSFGEYATAVLMTVAAEEGEVEPPSLAEFYGLDYDSTMALFFMQPAGLVPRLTSEERRAAGAGLLKALDAYKPEVRKAIVITLLDHAIVTGHIDWHRAKARHDVEVSA